MMPEMQVLFAASEVYPFSKSGGLADVAHALPRALVPAVGMTVVTPYYSFIDKEKFEIKPTGDCFTVRFGNKDFEVNILGCDYEGIPYLFVESELLSKRSYMYGPPDSGYEDNALRFALFSHAIMKLIDLKKYDLVHLNDWQCGLVAFMIHQQGLTSIKTVFTIHNLAYQGLFEPSVLEELDIDETCFTMEGIEFYNQVSFMKGGIAYADRVTTVSPHYAMETMTERFGCGLEGFLRHHADKYSGIVNGIDYAHFSPSNDAHLVHTYSDLKGKLPNKQAFLEELRLTSDSDRPLFVFIGRFTWQKGVDLLIEALDRIAALGCDVAILGEGETKYHEAMSKAAAEYENIHLHYGYSETLSHRMYAAADFLLMPSLFEPCGLNQMIAMRYGAIPVVHDVGGLHDTVHSVEEFDDSAAKGFGIRFAQPTAVSMLEAFEDALNLYEEKYRYSAVVRHNMTCDFSWQESAGHYRQLYHELLESEG